MIPPHLHRLALLWIALVVAACGDSKSKPESDGGDAPEDGSTPQTPEGGSGRDGGRASDGGGSAEDAGTGGEDAGAGACSTACAADDCGEVPKCGGGFLTCAACVAPQVCGQYALNKCGTPPPDECTPQMPQAACQGKCGAVSDGCSGVLLCNTSNGGDVCDSSSERCEGTVCKGNEVTCMPQTCASAGHTCGLHGDGCGGVLDCTKDANGNPACSPTERCKYAAISSVCEPLPNDLPTCTPLSRANACRDNCGTVGDGCGGTIDCESDPSTRCPSGQTCGGSGMSGQCGSSGESCIPTPASLVCAGKCGSQSNGCGGIHNCDASNGGEVCDASLGESCGAGGVPNVCGKAPCVAKTFAQACPSASGENKSCGQQPDGCGGLIDCGGCASNQQCGLANPSVCGTIPSCMPVPAATACAGKCGTVPDGCGGSYVCSGSNGGVSCTGNEYCGANSTPNKCGAPVASCVPRTCAQLGHSCGLASDGCGQVINCWPNCAPGDTACSGVCTSGACLANGTGAQSCAVSGPACTGSLCNSVPSSCAAGSPTRLRGRVVTPGRLVGQSYINRLPVPNAIVYIPADTTAALPPIFEGVEAGNTASCGRCEDEKLVATGESVLAAAVTDYKGDFTLEGRVPVGTAFRLVIKVGKWRRVVQVPSTVASACGTQALDVDLTRLAASQSDGLTGTHLPKIAVSTGSVDEMECVFRNIGLAESEFTAPSIAGSRIHLYRANGARTRVCNGTWLNAGVTTSCAANNNAGCTGSRSGCSWAENTVADSTLYTSQNTLNDYDLVVWDCEGAEQQQDADEPKVAAYVNAGGRMFASHFSYVWIENNGSLDGSADWGASGSVASAVGFISLPSGNTARSGANPIKSLLLRDWLDYQGALAGSTAGSLSTPPLTTPQFTISEPRDRAGANVGAATDEWVYRNARCSNGASQACSSNNDCRVCSNNATRFCTANSGCQNGGTCLPTGGTCSDGPRVQQLSFNTPYNAADDEICGRVAYSGFHVTATDNNDADDFFPGVCSEGELSAQEKILAFMLFDLATCVSAGDPPSTPVCTPKTAADVCPAVNDACGFVSDGCGGVVDCAGCGAGYYCDGNTCREQQCTVSTCASLGYNCGNHADGCGGIARNAQGVEGCGVCTGGQTCGLTQPGICGGCTQVPYATACPANSCGQVSDGCGGTHDCGTCPSGVCGGAGANRCGPSACTPIPQATACASKNCGLVADGCGGTYTCGTCVTPQTCGGDGRPNLCGAPTCVKKTVQQACGTPGYNCGFVSDGCGGVINCGSCPNNGVCGGGGTNVCGSSCTKTSCAAADAECGAISDLCGGLLDCGMCPMGQTCGASTPNKCGTGPACTPTNCAAVNAECGLVGDGCGGVLNCGTCTGAETCGGGGMANQCGTGMGGCNKRTCASPPVQCGPATDGCGGVLDCGSCASGYQCTDGTCTLIVI